MRPVILLVEDTAEILEDNKKTLEAEKYQVLAAQTVREARELLRDNTPDLMVLDIMLPDGSGVELCRELRGTQAAPVIFLTNLGESEQIVAGLKAGGDDYMVKPYRVQELAARIEAQLRRVERIRRAGFDTGTKRLSVNTRAQRVCLDGEDLLLKPKEYLLLLTLIHDQGRYFTAGELYTQVWGMNANGDVRAVEVHISRLRAKLGRGRTPQPVEIEYARGRGYRLLVTEDRS